MAVTVVQQTNTFDQWRIKTNTISANLGDTATLTTVADDAVAAINELDHELGNPAVLTTTDKANVVAAVNELDADTNKLITDVGDVTQLDSGDPDVVTAINNTSSTGRNFSIAMAIALG